MPLWQRLRTAPRLSASRIAQARFAEFRAALPEDEAAPLRALCEERRCRALLLGLADHSPFLWRLATADPARLRRLLESPPAASLAALGATLVAAAAAAGDAPSEIMRHLRRAKQESALLIALADLGGVWDLGEVTAALSQVADLFVRTALRHVLRKAHRAGRLALPDVDEPETGCGLVVLALGKHGAGELNYSSDIDLVVVFDPVSPAVPPGSEPAPLFVRLTQALVKLLQERTPDGYVHRVDLRLRPDPGASAIAIALPAALTYYEIFGQNWERAALIKGRPVAGDLPLGARILGELSSFIWRKYFDFAAIADVAAMKRQIHAVRGHDEIALAGHDVKLGRGGIREIEFFVQTQQLIFGGKRPYLRGSRTLDMLALLRADGSISAAAAEELAAAYIFLREVEHRLQMIDDEQTQRLPREPATLARFARFCGFADVMRFSAVLLGHLTRVTAHCARLFERETDLDAAAGSLVFTGVSDDPETLETLTQLGFKDPPRAAATVRHWHFGVRPAIRSDRAREVLTMLVPGLLQALGGSGDPDAGLDAFDRALAHMPAATELFSILVSHAALRELFCDILGSAPQLAELIGRRPHVLDLAITPAGFDAPLDDSGFDARASHLAGKASFEEFLDASRDFAQEEQFLIGLRLLSGSIEPESAGRAYAALAASLVRATLARLERDFAAEHGRVAGGRCIVLGLGKLGSREMHAASDLDLILIYDFDAQQPESDGARPLHAVRYYARLAQRLVSALTVATRRGRLYEVDMRLRPSGRKGPMATQLNGFAVYQTQEAETWEHMALSRARVVAGDAGLAFDVEATIDVVMRMPRGDRLRDDVFAMRRLIASVKGETNRWDLKYAAGGLIDIEFIAQYLVLRHAPSLPWRLSTAADIWAEAGRLGFLGTDMAASLAQAHRLYANVLQILRLTLAPAADPVEASAAVKRRLAAAADLPSFAQLERELADMQARVRMIFIGLLR